MKHLVTKRVKKGERRLFFENPSFNKGNGQILLNFKGLFGIELYYVKANLVAKSNYFYVDLGFFRYLLTLKIEAYITVGRMTTVETLLLPLVKDGFEVLL